MAVMNSAAKRPWVTSTNPIIHSPASLLARAPGFRGLSLDHIAWRRGEVTVADIRGKTRATQPFRHFNRRGHRPVAPSRAAECHRQIAFAGGPIAGNESD